MLDLTGKERIAIVGKYAIYQLFIVLKSHNIEQSPARSRARRRLICQNAYLYLAYTPLTRGRLTQKVKLRKKKRSFEFFVG